MFLTNPAACHWLASSAAAPGLKACEAQHGGDIAVAGG